MKYDRVVSHLDKANSTPDMWVVFSTLWNKSSHSMTLCVSRINEHGTVVTWKLGFSISLTVMEHVLSGIRQFEQDFREQYDARNLFRGY